MLGIAAAMILDGVEELAPAPALTRVSCFTGVPELLEAVPSMVLAATVAKELGPAEEEDTSAIMAMAIAIAVAAEAPLRRGEWGLLLLLPLVVLLLLALLLLVVVVLLLLLLLAPRSEDFGEAVLLALGEVAFSWMARRCPRIFKRWTASSMPTGF